MTEAGPHELEAALAAVRARSALDPLLGVVLGSGLGDFAATLEDAVSIPYTAIPGMPSSTVPGHAGKLCLGTSSGVPVACMQGRAHLYEGHDADRVTFAARLLAALGCHAVLLTNAAGGVAEGLSPGSLMLIVDHLNLTGRNPLVGPNDDRVGPRFLDLTSAYDPALCELARRAARDVGVSLAEGVYAAMFGPSYETPAEIRMLRTLGADAVGMSTVLEVIALRHRGVQVAAISCITNAAATSGGTKLTHEEVERTARQAREPFSRLLGRIIELAPNELKRGAAR